MFNEAPGMHCAGGNVVMVQQKVQSHRLEGLLSPKLFPGLPSVTPNGLPSPDSKKNPGPVTKPVAVLVTVLLYHDHVPCPEQEAAGVVERVLMSHPGPNVGVTAWSQLMDV